MKTERILDRLLIAASQKSKEKEYWLKKFSGEPTRNIFPRDYHQKKGITGLELINFIWEGDIYSRLVKLSNSSDYTMHMILTAGIQLLLSKYNDSQDITIGTPIYKQELEVDFVNTVLPLRNWLPADLTFRELLLQVHDTIIEAAEHYSYPLEILVEDLHLSSSDQEFPLFDVAVLLENIQDKSYLQYIPVNMLFSFLKTETSIVGQIQFNSQFYRKETVERIANHLTHLFREVLTDINAKLSTISILSCEEVNRLLMDFNNTVMEFPENKTLPQLFAEQTQKTPEKIAVRFHRDLSHICEKLKSGSINPEFIDDFKNCCFKKNPYIFQFKNQDFLEALNIFDEDERNGLIMLRTHKQNYVAVNSPVLMLMDYFDGVTNIQSLVDGMEKKKQEFRVYLIEKDEYTDFTIGQENKMVINRSVHDMIPLIQALYHAHLIELSGYDPNTTKLNIALVEKPDHGYKKEFTLMSTGTDCVSRNPVLLLGDRTGQATTGLLYIASFLRRNGIEAYCQWNDMNCTTLSLEQNVRFLLSKIQPKVVGVSLKWFPHIARVLEICKIVKAFNPSIKVVVGGNTASYFNDKIIKYEWVDYVVLGDGEVPFLHICTGEKEIPNCLYKIKENGKIKIIKTPITYVQNEKNSTDIFLSHLDKVFVNQKDPYLAPYFYINTGKGCAMQCFYCAGCKEAQKKIFNRDKPFLRGVEEVRKDLKEAKKYTSTFWFDFDLPLSSTFDYYKKLWEGLDLSDYFGEFYSWKLPSPEFIDFVVKTFKYVYLNIDLCSLSETHRFRLAAAGVVKPQPTDKELFALFDYCETYHNVEIIINQISGLPYFSQEDIQESSRVLSYLLKTYSTLGEMDWGRLHSQPGASITHTYKNYDMHCFASTFEDFLHYSQLNLQEDLYPGLVNLNYPYIYFQDDGLNSKISQHYVESNLGIMKYLEEKRNNLSMVIEVTYKELDEKSNQMARLLKQKHIQAETVVGIMMERSMEMIVGLLAVLKAGGSYLPLDPKYPAERLEYMLTNCNAPILLTRQNQLGKLKDVDFTGDIIVVDSPRDLPASKAKLEIQTSPNHLAYILYTSGTTGLPKGVMVEHRSVVRLVKKINYIDWTEDDRLLLTGSIVFDITTFEIWAALLNGVQLHLVDGDVILDEEKLERVIVENRITHLHLIPQVFDQMVSLRPGMFAGLRYLMVGGDLVRPAFVNQVRSTYPHLKILHMYGPTENTTFSTFFPVDKAYDVRIPIGIPISNSTVYILDKGGCLMPEGAIGELYTGGEGTARGYLNNVQLTVEKFISHPFVPGEKLYRTGDLVRWLPDGNLEFLGRVDSQLKIRGIRIEPGEIENQLLKHERIKEAVVIAVEFAARGSFAEGTPENYLCAYFAADTTFSSAAVELREFLSKTLPDYMIPNYFIQVERIPLTHNNKVDRQALPVPTVSHGVKHEIDVTRINLLLKESPVFKIEAADGSPSYDKPALEKLIAYFLNRWQNDLLRGPISVSGVDIDVFPDEKDLGVEEIDQLLHRLFEEIVQKVPDHIAVIDNGKQYTFRQVNEAANRLAHVLRSKGIETGSVVGLMVEQSVETIIGVLGIIKAGAAYIQVDPGFKSQEINTILENCNASFLVTGTSEVKNHTFKILQGLKFNEKNITRTLPRPQILDFDSIPIPDRSLIDYEQYNRYISLSKTTNSLTLQASRGCPYHCLYCHKIWPKKHVVRSAENIFGEIKLFYDIGVRRFSFVDDIFNLDVKNSSKVYEMIIKNNLDIQLHFVNGMRGDILTKDYIDLMMEARTAQLSLALETASPRLQRLLKKYIHLDKLYENLEYICQKYPDLILCLFSMIGFPTETEEEALMTYNYVTSLKWIHFPYLNILKIFPNTDMEKLALENGISREALEASISRAYHELPETLNFDKSVARHIQYNLFNHYILSKERLRQVIPHQMKIFTEREMIMDYRSHFNIKLKNFDELLETLGLTREELSVDQCLDESFVRNPGFNIKLQQTFPKNKPAANALRILLLDLSQFFSGENKSFEDISDTPIGLMYLLTYLNRELGEAVSGKIAKSMMDFDSYNELRSLMNEFKPDVIGIRALTLQQDFVHQAVAMIRQWGFSGAVICGGPYATSSYPSLLQDRNIDMVVVGEGEITFCELIRKIIENNGRLPREDILRGVYGIAFVSRQIGATAATSRHVIMLDQPEGLLERASVENITPLSRPFDPAVVIYKSASSEDNRKEILTHQQASHLVLKLNREIDTQMDFIASLMFDASLHQVFGSLLRGKILFIVSEGIRPRQIQLLEFYKKISTGNGGMPTAHIRLLMNKKLESSIHSLPEKIYNAPRNELEMKLVETWQEILGLERVGIFDNFFELGGHSVNAVKIAAKLKEKNINLTVDKLLQYQTIDQISIVLQENEKTEPESDTSERLKEIEDFLSNHFDLQARFHSYRTHRAIYNVLYVDKEIPIDTLKRALKTKVEPSRFPHYIRFGKSDTEGPETGKIDEETFARLMDLKLELTGEDNVQLKKELAKNQQLVKLLKLNQTRKKFTLSPSQQVQIAQYKHRDFMSDDMIFFSDKLSTLVDSREILEIVIRLINENSLLRSIVTTNGSGYCITEYEYFTNAELPFIDLSGYSSHIKEEYMKMIQKEILKPIKALHNLLYRVAALKLDESHYQIVFAFNHLIFDAESSFVLSQKIDNIRKGREDIKAAIDYNTYTNFMNDLNYDEIKLGKYVNMFQYTGAVDAVLENFGVETLKYDGFEISLSQLKVSYKDLYNEIILICYAKMIREMFAVDHVPINFITNGRNYKDGNFSNIIGDFHDNVPVLFSFNRQSEPVALFEHFLDYRTYIWNNNLNFKNYFLKNHLAGLNYSKLLSPFTFNAIVGMYDFSKRVSDDEAVREKIKGMRNNSGKKIFSIDIIKASDSDTLRLNYLQNSNFGKEEIKNVFIKNFNEVLNDL